jgi:hypothetical protein
VFVVPGLVTYFLDRTTRLTWSSFLNFKKTSSFHQVVAHTRLMSEDLVGVDLVATQDVLSSEAAYGTRYAALFIEQL